MDNTNRPSPRAIGATGRGDRFVRRSTRARARKNNSVIVARFHSARHDAASRATNEGWDDDVIIRSAVARRRRSHRLASVSFVRSSRRDRARRARA
jgi:hypothetical protein